LSSAITAGAFRSDLFYRLNVFPTQVPPLRKRKEDIPLLIEYFVRKFAEKMAKHIHKIEKRTLELCQDHAWPGNIRELQNIVERSMILCTGGDIFNRRGVAVDSGQVTLNVLNVASRSRRLRFGAKRFGRADSTSQLLR